MILGLIFFVLLYGLINYLIGKRIFTSLKGFKNVNPKLFWGIYSFLAASFILSSTLKNYLPNLLRKLLSFIGAYYLAFLFYIIILFILSYLIYKLFKKKQIKRDLYLISILLSIALIFVGTYFSNSVKIKNYDIKVDKTLKDDVSIVLVSDIHLGEIIGGNRLSSMVDKINSLNPDVVLIAGDLIDSDLNPVIDNNMLEGLKNIKSKYGTYFSLGNHDFYTGRDDELKEILASLNINVLRDDMVLINDSFYLIGRDDIAGKRYIKERSSIDEIKSSSSSFDSNKPVVVIDHNPQNIKDSIDNNIDLQVSGHTHRGQMFPINFITNSLFDIDYGYEKFKNTNAVVSSGFGTWGPPIRIGSSSEIVKINLHN